MVSLLEIHELVVEMKLLERRLTLYEEKYGVLSSDFYAALTQGKTERGQLMVLSYKPKHA